MIKFSIAIMTIAFLGAAAPAQALDSLFLEKAPGVITEEGNRLPLASVLSGLTTKTIAHTEVSPDCDANWLKVTIYYPQGTGNDKVDQALEQEIKTVFNEQVSETKTRFCDKEFCGATSCVEWPLDKSFAAYAPSPGFLSVLFNETSFTGGAHGSSIFEVMNFNLKTGERITLKDLFPDTDDAVDIYWDYVYAKWCAENGYKFPLHFSPVEGDCMADDPGNPRNYDGVKAIDDLGRLVFSPKGVTLVLGPYESGSYATGDKYLDIPKEDMIRMGASPVFWEGK